MLAQPFTVPGPAAVVPGTRLCHLLADETLLRQLAGNTGEDCVSALRSLNLPDNFWTDEFKVVPCSKTYAHKWTLCPCAHIGETARRRCPRTVNYKAVLCPLVKAKKTCPLGDACSYAHNVFEHWLHPSRYKTRLCSFGRNCNRSICFFAHSAEELRCVPCTDDKEGDEREYLMQILMAQESGLIPTSALEPVPQASIPPLLPTIMPDLSCALQQAMQRPLPPSTRTSVNGLPDAAAIMSARPSLNGVGVSDFMSSRSSMSGLPTDAGAVMMRASMSGVGEAHAANGIMLRGRPSVNGLPDRTNTAFASARASVNGLPDGGFGRARPSLNGLPDNTAATAAATNMLLCMQRAVSADLNTALNAANIQRAMSNELGVVGSAANVGIGMGASFHSSATVQQALSGDPSATFNAAAAAAAAAMERAFSRELSSGAASGAAAGSISPVHPATDAATAAVLERMYPGLQQPQQLQMQRELVRSGTARRDISHNTSINSVESDSLIQLCAGHMAGMGPGGTVTGNAVLGGFGASGTMGLEAVLQPPARLSDPGANFQMAMNSSVAGVAASQARVSDSGNKLGMISGKELQQGLESLLPLVNNALATGALALPMAVPADMRRSNSGGSNNSGRGLSPPLQEHNSSGSPSHSGSQTPLSSNSAVDGGTMEAPAAGLTTSSGAAAAGGSPPRVSEGMAAFEGVYLSAGNSNGIRSGATANFTAHQGSGGGGGLDQSYLNNLVARLQDQGVNKDQLVSSLSQILAQLLSVQ